MFKWISNSFSHELNHIIFVSYLPAVLAHSWWKVIGEKQDIQLFPTAFSDVTRLESPFNLTSMLFELRAFLSWNSTNRCFTFLWCVQACLTLGVRILTYWRCGCDKGACFKVRAWQSLLTPAVSNIIKTNSWGVLTWFILCPDAFDP